jgi:hypothetical protein
MQIVVILRVSGLSSFISHASGSLDIIFHALGLVPPHYPPLVCQTVVNYWAELVSRLSDQLPF